MISCVVSLSPLLYFACDPECRERLAFQQQQEERQQRRLEAEEAARVKEQQLVRSREQRSRTTKALTQRTRTGQPLMGNMLGHLLTKIQKQQAQGT